MFHEYRHVIATMKNEDNYFHSLFEKHNQLDEKIVIMEKEHSDEFEIEKNKKEKLRLKDEIYNLIISFKKNNNL